MGTRHHATMPYSNRIGQNTSLFAAGTGGGYEAGAHFHIQGDGHAMMHGLNDHGRLSYDVEDIIWQAKQNGFSGTEGCFCCMQNDGNFVMYNSDNEPIWSTGTDGGQQGSTEGDLR